MGLSRLVLFVAVAGCLSQGRVLVIISIAQKTVQTLSTADFWIHGEIHYELGRFETVRVRIVVLVGRVT